MCLGPRRQEQEDLELALRLQREEEERASHANYDVSSLAPRLAVGASDVPVVIHLPCYGLPGVVGDACQSCGVSLSERG